MRRSRGCTTPMPDKCNQQMLPFHKDEGCGHSPHPHHFSPIITSFLRLPPFKLLSLLMSVSVLVAPPPPPPPQPTTTTATPIAPDLPLTKPALCKMTERLALSLVPCPLGKMVERLALVWSTLGRVPRLIRPTQVVHHTHSLLTTNPP